MSYFGVGGNLIGTGTPSIVAESGAGTSPTISITGNDSSGLIDLTTGTSPAKNVDFCTVTFEFAFATAPRVTFSPANANAGAMVGINQIRVGTTTTTTFKLVSEAFFGLAASTNYQWNYHVIG